MNGKLRLHKAIANYGYCSRRKAEKLILDKKVKVNGVLIKEVGVLVDTNDVISIDNKIISSKLNKKIYILFNKPRSVISSTSDPQNRKTILDFFNHIKERIYPVGRLDYDTTGLIILTNDGEFTNLITHPKYEINKKYLVVINGILEKNKINKLENGIKLDDNFITSKAKITKNSYNKLNDKSYIEIIIHEGKNHQVKKMFEKIKNPVLKLSRIEIDILKINDLKPGNYRNLTVNEIKHFFNKFS